MINPWHHVNVQLLKLLLVINWDGILMEVKILADAVSQGYQKFKGNRSYEIGWLEVIDISEK